MIKHPGYEYQTIDVAEEREVRRNPALSLEVLDDVTNRYAQDGWRTVSALIVGGSIWLLMERTKRNPHDQHKGYVENQRWHDWVEQYGEVGAWP